MAAAIRCYGTGRRKTAVARVWVQPGSGSVMVNGRKADDYFARPTLAALIEAPVKAVELYGRLDVTATAKGGGISGQAGAVAHGIARALIEYDPDLRTPLRRLGFLTRDPRVAGVAFTGGTDTGQAIWAQPYKARDGESLLVTPSINQTTLVVLPNLAGATPTRLIGLNKNTGQELWLYPARQSQ